MIPASMRAWFREAAAIRFQIKGDEMTFHIGLIWLVLIGFLLAKCGGAA